MRILLKILYGGLMFILGVLIAAAWIWCAQRSTQYLDRRHALAFAIQEVRAECIAMRYGPFVDCQHFDVTETNEDKDGWTYKMTSYDGRRRHQLWIGRRGEHVSMGVTDLNKPNDVAG
jgi:hypothetical protein